LGFWSVRQQIVQSDDASAYLNDAHGDIDSGRALAELNLMQMAGRDADFFGKLIAVPTLQLLSQKIFDESHVRHHAALGRHKQERKLSENKLLPKIFFSGMKKPHQTRPLRRPTEGIENA
jgi:hypothetical protein